VVTRGEVDANRVEEPFIPGGDQLAVWSAAAAGQYSWEYGGSGVFTTALVDGAVLRKADQNQNGIVTNAELLDYTRTRTLKYCETIKRCKSLGFTPQLEASARIMAAPTNGSNEAPPNPCRNTSGKSSCRR
jgi:uncharacterized caspase-like protein